MPFYVIRGTFHIKGYSLDGDSIRFQADDEANWQKLSGPPAGLNGRRHAQLRLEAIDTLETHYAGEHQPMGLATAALDALLARLGIASIEADALWSTVTEAEDGTQGYIVTRQVEKYGRPVAFVYAGAPPEADGARIYLTAERLRQSVNYSQLQTGMAYPTYYQGLFHDLREACTEAVAEARAAAVGVWPVDRTNSGFAVTGLESITEQHVILPKLFRRLVYYLQGGGPVDGFVEFLAGQMDEVFVISTAQFTHLDTLVEVTGNTVRLTEPPENLVFLD